MSYSKKPVLFALSMLASAALVAHAEPEFSMGGYNTQLQTMEMMGMVDANNDHMVSKEEFNKYYNELFDILNNDKNNFLDEKEWLGSVKDNKISVATGGYSRQLRTIKTMKAIDSDANHQVSKQEFVSYHEALFKRMDAKAQGEVNPQDWLRSLTQN